MSYAPEDAAWDEAYENMSRELYPEHKALAILDFTYERLRSFYVANPEVLVPAVRNFNQAKVLLNEQHYAPALVFAASATELFLKGSLLRPVVFGLVHSESLAELVVSAALAQTGFKRYEKLLAGMFLEITSAEITSLIRPNGSKPLLEEASQLQERRNAVVHRGEGASANDAEQAVGVAAAVLDQLLSTVLYYLGLSMEEGGHLVDHQG